MKECNSDVCEDQSRNMEMMFVVYSFYDVRRKQLVVSQQKLDDKEIQYLDHLPTGVFTWDSQVTLFMWNRFYVFNHTEAHSSSAKVLIEAFFRQIEQYFQCQWCPVAKSGLFAQFSFHSNEILLFALIW